MNLYKVIFRGDSYRHNTKIYYIVAKDMVKLDKKIKPIHIKDYSFSEVEIIATTDDVLVV